MEQPNLIDLPDIVIDPKDKELLKRSGDRPYTWRGTIDQAAKYVGKRVSVSTGTKDIRIAAMCRMLIVESLKAAGFIISDEKFSRPEEDFNNMALHDNIKAVIFDLRGEDDEMADTLQDAIDNAK